MLSNLCKRIAMLFSAMAVMAACESYEEISIQDSEVEMFLYDSPITSLTDAGDSLLLGTAKGDIVSFSLSDGSFRTLYHDLQSRFIYQVVKSGDGTLLYSVQDGGVNHLHKDGTIDIYEIDSFKKSNYSAYRMIYEDDKLYTATSNGAYAWTTPSEYGYRMDQSIQSDLKNPVSSRFYSIERIDDNGFLCGGEAGLYSFDECNDPILHNSSSLYASHGNITLSRDRKVCRDGKYLCTLNVAALDFVTDGKYLYAVSMSAVEVIDVATGKHVLTINLPEHKSAYKNASCRSFCLIRDDHLYIAPGSCTLYRMPLYDCMSSSQEVDQVCAIDEETVYAITYDNDLYRFDVSDGEVDYRRSFDKTDDVELIGGYNGNLLVTINEVYYALSGRRLTDQKYLDDLNKLNKSKVLWHLSDGAMLYQGQVDGIRVYDGGAGWKLAEEFGLLDYPKHAALSNGSLVVHTMHEGCYLLNDGRYEKVSGMPEGFIKAVAGGDNFICALTDTAVVLKTMSKDNYPVYLDGNSSYKHLTDLFAFTDRSFLVFSTYNRWRKGVSVYSESDDSSWKCSRRLQTYTINDATKVGNSVVVAGSMGLAVVKADAEVSIVAVSEPTFFQKYVLAWNYPWGIVIFITVLVIVLALLIWSLILIRRRYLKYKKRKMGEAFYLWVKSEFEGEYVRLLAKQLIKVSSDCRKLETNISLFKNNQPQLKQLEKLVGELVDLYNKVKSLKAHDIEKDRREEIAHLKEQLEYFCRSEHPFGDSIIKSWGKSTVQPVRTLMLLPLKFKIKYMQIFDSRTGTEKMDFKTFMDNNKAEILKRNLEIRDLIALSAYEAIVAENHSTDA